VGFAETWLLNRMLIWIPLVLSLTLHEWAHAFCAWQLGDPTAQREGRLTLDPLEHMDPIGTFLLPLLGIPFGWAKPVPIDPSRFRGSMNVGLVLTALAGPLSNLVLALIAVVVAAVLVALGLASPHSGSAPWRLIEMLVLLNVLLASFNLLPIPPLDGSRIVDGLLPDGLRPAWDAFAHAAPYALAAVIVIPLLTGFSLFTWPMEWADTLLDTAAAFAPAASDLGRHAGLP
jgi:Zn-dependent protease